MKRVFLYKTLAFITAILITSIGVKADHNLQNRFVESFKIDDNASLIIVNRYGFVDCKLWNKDSIRIEMDVNLEGNDLEDLEELMESITPRFSAFNNIIEVETDIDEGNSDIIDQLFSLLDIFSKKEIDINYTIYAPAETSFDIKNKFGDVMLDNFTGRTRVELSYGDFLADRLGDGTKLDLSYGKMNARYFESGDVKLKHYKAKLRNANNLNLESVGSDLQIGSVKYLSLKSNKDELEIDTVGLLRGSAKLSDIEILSLGNTINLILENVNIDIKKVDVLFEDFDLDQKGSYIDINVDGLSFTLDAELEGSKMSVPKTVSNIEKDMIDEKKNHRTIDLTYGDSPSKKIILKGKYGSFNLLAL